MRIPVLARLAAVALAWVLLVAATGFLLRSHSGRSLATSAAAAERARIRLESIDYRRDALWGETAEGSAFEAYREVRASLGKKVPEGDISVRNAIIMLLESEALPPYSTWTALGSAPPASTASVEELVRALLLTPGAQRALAAVRRGAHCRDADPGVDWSRPMANSTLKGTAGAANILIRAHANEVSLAGDPIDAARWILDAAQMGLDLARAHEDMDQADGRFTVVAAFSGPTVDYEDLPRLGRSGRREWLTALPRVIDRLKAIEPNVDAMELDHLRGIEALLQRSKLGALDELRQQRAMASTLTRFRVGCEAVRGGYHESWSDGQAAATFWAGQFTEPDSWGQVYFRSLVRTPSDLRGAADRLLALKVALQVDLDGVAPPTLDSNGAPITHQVVGDEILVTLDGQNEQESLHLRRSR